MARARKTQQATGPNFQPFVDKREIKDGSDEDLTLTGGVVSRATRALEHR